MVTDVFISLISTILDFAFGWLPRVSEMPEWYDTIYNTLSVFSALGAFPVIGTVIQITSLVLTILAGWQVVVWANWLYNKIRGSG